MLDSEEIDVVADMCSGEKIIKQKPKSFITLMASGLTEERFNNLFKEATHVQLCIKIDGTNFKTIRMPKLKRMFPCKERSESLVIENNPNLETVTLGSKETSIVNMHVKNNPNIRASSVSKLKRICSKLEKSTCEIDDTGVTGVYEDKEEQLETTETTQTMHVEESAGRSTVLSEGLGGGDEDKEDGYFADDAQLNMFSRDEKYGVHRKVEENRNESQMLCSYSFYIMICALILS
ncbi:unnamed protein product [Cylicocyclus nassatus]|uniref:Uncharacterized protein n=1 Tax=Cylicocyclus nassatus TaxID=53992 RepID=A0AA36GPC7_CYLNA|nr:unnamed protein product [Cylicocyclus nassatus]